MTSLVFTLIIASALFPQWAKASTYFVRIEAMKFQPSILRVKTGDTIVWTNEDFLPHTVTAMDKSFNSRNIPASGKWTFKALKAGNYPYKCLFHLPMKASFIVE